MFVEVKSLGGNYAQLSETITIKKIEHLKKSCLTWLNKNDLTASEWRIDFVGVSFDQGRLRKLVHYEGGIY